MPDEIDPCVPDFVDGQYVGCGACPECHEDEDRAIEEDVEMGLISDDEAAAIHAVNDLRRALDDDSEFYEEQAG